MTSDPTLEVQSAPTHPAERAAFAERVIAHLSRHEAENNLPLSITADIADGRYEAARLLLAVDASARALAALVWTPPFNLLVCYGDEPRARAALLADLLARGEVPPGVTGPEPAAGEVARWLAERAGGVPERHMRQGVYRLERVTPKPRAAGAVRELRRSDAEVFVPWLRDFGQEAGADLRPAEDVWRTFMESPARTLYVLEVEGRPTCLVGVGGRTPNGRRIGPVYTPPEHRRRGYAEALVAHVCEALLAAGARFCFLYTDLDYATSNSVYRKVGFAMILESAEYRLQGATG